MKPAKLLLILSLCAFTAVSAARAGEDNNSGVSSELVNFGLKFLDDPGDFFFNLHTDNEDFSPLPPKRRAAVRFNFFPTAFPLTWVNLNLKVKLKNDIGYWPQIDMVGEYGDMLALRMISTSSKNDDGSDKQEIKPVFNDYSFGPVISKKANDATRIFGGFKYSSVNMEVSFSSPIVMGAFSMSRLSFKVADTFVFMGLSHQTGPESFLVAQAAYGIKYKKITSRIMMSHPHFEIGMDIFPEGLLVWHPFMAWHWYF